MDQVQIQNITAAIHALQQERERFRLQIMCWEQNPENEEEVERRFHEYEVQIQKLIEQRESVVSSSNDRKKIDVSI